MTFSKNSSWRDLAASSFHRFSRLQSNLFWWYSEKVFSQFFLKRPVSLIEKVSRWAKRCFLIALALPLLSWTLLLAETELLTRISAHMVAQKSYSYLPGKAVEKIFHKKAPLTLFSLNTCFVPGGFSLVYGGVAPWSERIDKVIEQIQKNDADILCLQEVNDLEAAYRLYDSLKDRYSHFYFNIGPKVLSQNSGLFVASKYAIQDPSFVTFDAIVGTQKMVNKGFFDGKIVSDGKVIAHLFTTHLSPSSDDGMPTLEEKKIRQKELDMIFAKMKLCSSAPILFAGDLNIDRNQDEAHILQEFSDLFPKGAMSSATDLLKQVLHARTEEEIAVAKLVSSEFAIDYILFKSDTLRCKGKVSVVKSYDRKAKTPTEGALSDHHALLGEFYLST